MIPATQIRRSPFLLDAIGDIPEAAFSLRRLTCKNSRFAIRVRRSNDNAESDIPFRSDGILCVSTLLSHCLTPQYPLDGVGVEFAGSVRRLRSGYTGDAIRVRRSNDSAELDIGLTASGDLDTVTLLAFCGVNSGFVTTLYDQSGNGRHATQTSAAVQPRIVNAGVLVALNGKPYIERNTINDRLFIPAISPTMTSAGVLSVYAQASTNNGFCPFFFNSAGGFEHLPWTDGGAYIGTFSAFRQYVGSWSSPANTPIIASTVQSGTALSAFRNGTQVGTTISVGFAAPSPNSGLFLGSLGFLGLCSELIVLSSAPTDDQRKQIERSQAAYFGVTHSEPISGYVTTWYEQGVNRFDLKQTNAVNQPRIVNAGVVETLNGRPSIAGDGNQYFDTDSVVARRTCHTIVRYKTGAETVFTNWDAIYGSPVDINSNELQGYNGTSGFLANNVRLNGSLLSGSSPTAAVLPSGVGSVITHDSLGVLSTRLRVLGEQEANRFWIGAISEIIVFAEASKISTQRLIEQSQSKFYRIPVL